MDTGSGPDEDAEPEIEGNTTPPQMAPIGIPSTSNTDLWPAMEGARYEDINMATTESDGESGLPGPNEYGRTLTKKESIKRRLDDFFDKQWDVNADVRGLDSLLKRLDITLREFERTEVRVPLTWSQSNRDTMFTR
ncbi:hypothetical protein QFC19_003016 [Naganishia cerealis]|uniref:Uncharacterized protein n=2 Tax=Naganishia cerealis TaxID=610337 RepID=A0ACC2W549_9TREE|nr:hypothetical protein QFC19_003332 [Naganishia cerealis]KAJ9106885.1 hypothetical protein QFC19_003016 [Naganishia cerealis]